MTREQMDQLLSSVIDGCDESTWTTFVSHAELQPCLWRELAEMQRDQALLGLAINVATAVADRVEVPADHEARRSFQRQPGIGAAGRSAALPMRHWLPLAGGLGWAAAAALALAMFLTHEKQTRVDSSPRADANNPVDGTLVRIASPDDAVREYVMRGRETGQVVGEMPTRLLIESRPSSTGEGFDVVYLRQFMERDHVPALYQPTGRDEAGRATLVNYEPSRGSSM